MPGMYPRNCFKAATTRGEAASNPNSRTAVASPHAKRENERVGFFMFALSSNVARRVWTKAGSAREALNVSRISFSNSGDGCSFMVCLQLTFQACDQTIQTFLNSLFVLAKGFGNFGER